MKFTAQEYLPAFNELAQFSDLSKVRDFHKELTKRLDVGQYEKITQKFKELRLEAVRAALDARVLARDLKAAGVAQDDAAYRTAVASSKKARALSQQLKTAVGAPDALKVAKDIEGGALKQIRAEVVQGRRTVVSQGVDSVQFGTGKTLYEGALTGGRAALRELAIDPGKSAEVIEYLKAKVSELNRTIRGLKKLDVVDEVAVKKAHSELMLIKQDLAQIRGLGGGKGGGGLRRRRRSRDPGRHRPDVQEARCSQTRCAGSAVYLGIWRLCCRHARVRALCSRPGHFPRAGRGSCS